MPIVETIVRVPPCEKANTAKEGDKMPWWKDRQFVLQLLIFVTGVIVAVIYECQLREMAESNKINREAMESVQRAFVDFIGWDTTQEAAPDGHYFTVFYPKWENAGNTSAMHLVSYFEADTVKTDSIDGFPFKEHFDEIEYGYLGPHSPPVRAGAQTLRDTDIFDLPVGETAILWGWKAYADVFHNAHVTEFCDRVAFANPVPTPDNPKADFRKRTEYMVTTISCQVHNCADNDCPDHQRIEEYVTAKP